MPRYAGGGAGLSATRPVIAYVVPFAFPSGGAGARRVLGNAQSLNAVGYDVLVISAQTNGVGLPPRPFAPGISIVSTGERHSEHLPRALKRARYALMGRRTRRVIATAKEPLTAVILYSGYTPYLLQLSGLCRRRGIPLLFDAVEWYSASSTLRFMASPYLWNTEFAMRALVPRLSGVIAISSYLANYYRTRGLAVAQVPPTLDTRAVTPRFDGGTGGSRLRLAYCGSASNDSLGTVIAALMRVDPLGVRFTLDISGPSVDEVALIAGLSRGSTLPAVLNAHGRASHAEALEIKRAADFSIFLREINRVSTAGFPTKFAESLTLGTPVITNLTSDLAEDLRDGENGLVCPHPTLEALLPVLERAHVLRGNRLAAMRRSARASAEARFDIQRYGPDLRRLLENCGASAPQHAKGTLHFA